MKSVCKTVVLLSIIAGLGSASFPQNDSELLRDLDRSSKAPADYIVDKFKSNSVVLLGEDHAVKQTLLFVQEIIPKLHAAGVYNLGMEFGATEDQTTLDQLIDADKYDEETAKRLMFNYNSVWSWKEYRDIYRKAWEFNRALPRGARKFRIVNLSYRFQWKEFTPPRTPENMTKVFFKGTVDKYRAEVIEKEIVNKGEKVLAVVGTPHAFTKYASSLFLYNNDNFCAFDSNWLGSRLYRKYPGKITNVIVHQPFYAKPGGQTAYVSPAKGVIERLMKLRGNAPAGFDLSGSPIGSLPDDSSYSICYDRFTIGRLFDGYIFLAPFSELRPAQIDEEFVTEENAGRAIEQFPDPDWHGRPRDLNDLRSHIRKAADDIGKKYSSLSN